MPFTEPPPVNPRRKVPFAAIASPQSKRKGCHPKGRNEVEDGRSPLTPLERRLRSVPIPPTDSPEDPKLHAVAAIALFGCAARSGLIVTEAELSSLAATLSAMAPNEAVESYEVSGIRVRDREVVVLLSSTARGEGWRQVSSGWCRRPIDGDRWRCFSSGVRAEAWRSDGSRVEVVGLDGDEAVRILRRLAQSRDPAHPPMTNIECLVGRGEEGVVVQYAGVLHHGQSSHALALVRDVDGRLIVEQVAAAPDWFEGPSRGFWECDVGRLELDLTK